MRKKAVKTIPKKKFQKISKKKLTTTNSSGILNTVTEKEVKDILKSHLKKLKKVKEKVDNRKTKWYIIQRCCKASKYTETTEKNLKKS